MVFTRVPQEGFDEFLSDEAGVLALVEDMGFEANDMMALLSGADADPATLYNLMEGRWSGEQQTFSLEKEWQLCHFLTTGDADVTKSSPHPLALLNQGGRKTHIHTDHAAIRVLSPNQVEQVHTALEALTLEQLMKDFEIDQVNAANISPHGSNWSHDDAQAFWDLYPALQLFFSLAHENKEFVLVSML